jgi:CspA family cold shock protein
LIDRVFLLWYAKGKTGHLGEGSSMKRTGKVKWFNETKGYGFIEQNGEKDVFVHYTAIRMDGYRTLKEGQSVVYTVLETPKGLQASEVVAM